MTPFSEIPTRHIEFMRDNYEQLGPDHAMRNETVVSALDEIIRLRNNLKSIQSAASTYEDAHADIDRRVRVIESFLRINPPCKSSPTEPRS